MSQNIFFTSDSHFGHNREFLYKPRGFNNINEHNEAIIQNWNSIVQPNDIVYHLGDIMLNDDEQGLECLQRLNGYIWIIRGNHDSDNRLSKYISCLNVISVEGWATMIKDGKQSIYLSHFPTITSNYDIDKPLKARILNLCGHSHTKDPFADWNKGLIYHVELDAHNNRPVALDDIMKDIRKRLEE